MISNYNYLRPKILYYKMTLGLTTKDIIKLGVPFFWSLVSIIAFIVYLTLPTYPRWEAAIAWLISTIISVLLTINIWRYHTKEAYGYKKLPESLGNIVNFKLIFSACFSIITFVLAIYFWAAGNSHTYANACAYTVSCIFIPFLWESKFK